MWIKKLDAMIYKGNKAIKFIKQTYCHFGKGKIMNMERVFFVNHICIKKICEIIFIVKKGKQMMEIPLEFIFKSQVESYK